MYRQSLAVRETALGRDHPDVATNLNNLAKVMQDLGKDQQIGASEARARARTGGGVGGLTEIGEHVPARARHPGPQPRARPSRHRAHAEQPRRPARGARRLRAGRARCSAPRSAPWRRCSASSIPTPRRCSPRSRSRSTTRARSSRPRRPTSAPSTSRASTGNPRALLINDANLGYALAKRGRYREALPYYKEAIETVDFLYSQTRGYSEETRAAVPAAVLGGLPRDHPHPAAAAHDAARRRLRPRGAGHRLAQPEPRLHRADAPGRRGALRRRAGLRRGCASSATSCRSASRSCATPRHGADHAVQRRRARGGIRRADHAGLDRPDRRRGAAVARLPALHGAGQSAPGDGRGPAEQAAQAGRGAAFLRAAAAGDW